MRIKKNRFGLLADGSKIHLYTISNGKMSFSVTDYGCIITSILVPDVDGKRMVDVSLGFSTLDGFVMNHESFGALVGRFANRIGNASFSIDGKEYKLDKNDGSGNTLHSGFDRWDKKVWKARTVVNEYGVGVSFSRRSPDGEQGFPGNADISVTYALNDNNDISIIYEGETDKPTVMNFTNHSYFNLLGHNGGSVDTHLLQMSCSKYLEVNDVLIPTGNKADVSGTPYDFTKKKAIGTDIGKVGVGYDNCYCVDGFKGDGSLLPVAVVEEPESGRKMIVKSTLPGVQLYTGNYIENIKGKDGFIYHKHGALCLETQEFPDAPNKSEFPPTIVRPGERYIQTTQYSFVF